MLCDMTKRPTKRATERLAKNLLKMGNNHHAVRAISRLQTRMELIALRPMKDILAMLAVETPTERARLLGISRQCLYDWMNEKTRPNLAQAAKLAELTGLSIREIRARD